MMKMLPVLMVGLLLTVAATTYADEPTEKKTIEQVSASENSADKPDKKEQFELTETEQKLFDLTNAERKRHGVSVLAVSTELFRAARQHSENMARQGVMSHTLNGRGVSHRVYEQGYNFSRCAENIAMGQDSPEEAIRAWMNSYGHRVNLLGSGHTQLGVSVATSPNGHQYWTMVLAAPGSN